MDVINMSLGSPFGSADDPAAVAASNAAKDGVIVVASSGNDGYAAPYLTGSPASGSGVISVAANDSTPVEPRRARGAQHGLHCGHHQRPRLKYHAVAYSLTDGTADTVAGVASFNAFSPAISTGMFDVLGPGASATETVSINSAEFAQTPALGVMVVSHDNRSKDEAQLIAVKLP